MTTAAATATFPTLLDLAKRTDPDGSIADIVEVLANTNPIIGDAAAMEGNLPTGHRSTQRTTDPSGTWRLLNKGVPAEKSTTKQMDDTTGMLESYSQVDIALAKLNGNEAAFRASEDNGFVTGLSNTAATAIFYSNSKTDPEKMHGLAPRYGALTSGEYDDQIINGGGSGSDNTSVWLITWGPKYCTLITPKGSMAGLQSQDLGQVTNVDSNGLMHEVYRTHFVWNLGLALIDFRYVIRICNIDDSNLTADGATGADLSDLMIDAYYARPTVAIGDVANTVFYCNKTIAKFLHKQAQNKSNVNLTIDMPAGKPQVSFLDAPIHVCDALAIDEATIA